MKVRSTPSKYKVELLPHDPNWANLYNSETKKLTSVFGDALHAIHHIGSTSIPAIKAKPIIDVLIETNTPIISSDVIYRLENQGYTERLFNDGRARRTFNKDQNGVRLYNVHVVYFEDDFGKEMLAFCDVLRENVELAKEYEALKIRNASVTSNTKDYYEAKAYFFNKALGQ